MNYCLYKAKSPSGKTYIGITNCFKRRMKEHGGADTPFGRALRKYGRENFEYEFEMFDSAKDAASREAELVTLECLAEGNTYNQTIGGTFSNTLIGNNPMFDRNVVENHPNVWKKGGDNPMKDPEVKARMIESQACKRVSIKGEVYYGVREASRIHNISRQLCVYRLKSSHFSDWFYL